VTALAAAPGRMETPHPLADELPGLFADDDFIGRWCAGLDQVLAPVLVALDCLDAYTDPRLTPDDFVEWLSGWVGIARDSAWPTTRQRALIEHAVELYRWEGTARGLRAHVALLTGHDAEVSDSGGVAWSAVPDGPLPGSPTPALTVRVRAPGAAGAPTDGEPAISVDTVDAVVGAARPAHVPHRVELVD